jgi:hypothetical protein
VPVLLLDNTKQYESMTDEKINELVTQLRTS